MWETTLHSVSRNYRSWRLNRVLCRIDEAVHRLRLVIRDDSSRELAMIQDAGKQSFLFAGSIRRGLSAAREEVSRCELDLSHAHPLDRCGLGLRDWPAGRYRRPDAGGLAVENAPADRTAFHSPGGAAGDRHDRLFRAGAAVPAALRR